MERYKQKQRKKRQRQYLIFAAVAVILIVIGAYVVLSQPASYPARTPSPPLDNIPTISGTSNLAEHYHIHLDIYINGTPYVIPADLGHVADDRIFYALHTHDTSGVIHIEAPSTQTFTLGQVFEVYGYTLNNNQIFDKTGQVTMYVNNGVTPHQFDTGYGLHSGDEIALVFGPPPANIPSSYGWQSNPCILNC